MMGTVKHIGRIGAVAPGIRNVRRTATRMAVSIGVAALVVMSTVVPAPTVSPAVRLATSTAPCTQTDVTCALIMGTSGVPTPDDFYVESVKNQFIAPTHPGQIDYVKVTTPEELWPLGGFGRLVSLLGLELGDPEIFGPGGPSWDVPWWKLFGLFDLTLNQSILHGVTDLEQAMAEHPNDHRVIFGYSQSAAVANRVKQSLAKQYPAGTTAPDIDFVLGGDLNLPNGGLLARFPGLYIPVLDWFFNGPAPTDTPFDTIEITRQYDFMADFPLYPLNLVADLNALLGFFYVHTYPFAVSLAADPSTSPPIHRQYGDTDYYFFPTEDLPLFAPLRRLGVPESVIDVVEPFFKVIVDLGYDRSIPPWEPTPARLIPPLKPGKVVADLVTAIGEGINNAFALFGSPVRLRSPVPVTLAAPGTETAKRDISPQVMSTGAAGGIKQISTDMAPSTTTVTETGRVTSTKDVTETAEADEASARPTAASAPEASADASTRRAAKPLGRPATPRPVVRGSLGVGQQLHDLPHRGKRDQPTTQGAAASNGAATAGPSSVASSPAASSAGTNSAGGNSSGGDADDS